MAKPPDRRAAIIVVGFEGARHLPAFLASLPAAVAPHRPAICLVDNHSADRTASLFEEFARGSSLDVHVHRAPANLGFTGGSNLAFELLEARGPFDAYVLVNPDTVLARGWLGGLLQTFDDASVGLAGSLMLLPDGRLDAVGCGLHFLGFGFTRGFGGPAAARPPRAPSYIGGASLAISREALARAQALSGDRAIFWPELFLYHDDLELAWRVRLAGLGAVVSEESRLVHDHDFAGSPQKFFFLERNRFLVLFCYYRLRTLLLLWPLLMLAELALFACDRRLGPAGRLRVYAAVARELARGSFWRRRRRVQGARAASDREILAHLVGSIEHPEMEGRSFLNRGSEAAFRMVRALVRW
jgi:GT2 family glycosyltransferase